jgi:hypothetical protein
LTQESKTSRPDQNAYMGTHWAFVWVSRCLLILTTLSLIAMPITERLWNWDHFLQSGRDFEISLILLLSFFCLVMVHSRTYKRCVDVLLSAQSVLAAPFEDLVVFPEILAGSFLNLQRAPPPNPGICGSDTRLQI